MLLLRYQQKRQEEDGGRSHSEHDMRRKITDKDIKGDSRRAATRGTLICIFVCGSFLLTLGLVILFVGLLVPGPKKDPTPWLVIGPTCIVLGILVLLLSVEIILKLRKISSSRSSAEPETPMKKRKGLNAQNALLNGNGEENAPKVPKPIPVIVHPATPMQQLDAASLTVDIVQHR